MARRTTLRQQVSIALAAAVAGTVVIGVLGPDPVLAAGRGSSAAQTTSGRLYVWGDDSQGQLGDGTPGGTVTTPKISNLQVGHLWNYTYNADGLLRGRQSFGASAANLFAWDQAEGLPTVVKDGATAYINGPDGIPVERIDTSGTPNYLHTDQLGSVRVLTTASGTVKGTATFDAYGKRVATTGTYDSSFGYAGQYVDTTTTLIYMRARWYDPDFGTFLGRDPLEATTKSAYGYVGGNPLNATDPTGEIVPVLLGAWAAVEIGLAVWDAADAYGTLSDPCATGGAKGLAVGLALVGGVLPGGGYGKADNVVRWVDDVAPRTAGGLADAASGARLNARLTADEIAGGHAFTKHVVQEGQFPGIRTRAQFGDMIENVVNNFGDIRHLSGGRTAYWRDGVVVIRNPSAVDGGTAFVPRDGYDYFLGLG